MSGLRLEASTIHGYGKIIRNQVTPQLGTVSLDKITAIRLAAHYRELERCGRADGKGLSPNSVHKEIRVWTGRQLAAFLAWDRDTIQDEFHPLWHTLAYTGMRRGEALALTWGDLSTDTGRLSIRRAADAVRNHEVKPTKTPSGAGAPGALHHHDETSTAMSHGRCRSRQPAASPPSSRRDRVPRRSRVRRRADR